jgi:hypothetical protein
MIDYIVNHKINFVQALSGNRRYHQRSLKTTGRLGDHQR